MSFGETPITIIGNLTADPELKFTNSGAPLVKFTIASTPRTYNKESGQWGDGTAAFFRCAAWRRLAEHIAESLTKGTRVVLSGRIRQHNWQTPEGENRSMLAVEVDDIGPSLQFATATVQRNTPAPAGSDPWGVESGDRTTTGAVAPVGSASEEPPF
ncbi:single-stranded DNA-binding protein [Streptomyces natalensis]|uniref:Single-stranded DNA-binding protein n=1 Tax=Streptomyces natalensis ATCC 27448 TaxID=1240678 RepID=A0A0D7CMB4_9ACTN|nr:single-stranded DNA-binding protein [Streptomyces natalensis]KIZ17364.1 single-stranded DNA-binding protein [Streptomyces natalensis ATCC 27448]